ncbi:MAG: glycosyltransferase [bacterium]
MPKVLYVWKGKYPWDIRAEKICKALIQQGFDVFLLGRWTEGQMERENIDGINIIRVGYNKNYNLTQPMSYNPIWKKAIKQAIDEIKPDIIMPRDIMLAEACGKLGRNQNIPVIMDMAENYPAAMKDWKKYKKSFLSRLAVHYLNLPELVEKRAVNIMDGIITVCDEQNLRLYEEYRFGMDMISVVHNTPKKEFFDSVDSNRLTVDRKTISNEELGIRNSQINTIPDLQLVNESGKGNKDKIVFGHHGFTSDEKSLVTFLFGFEQAAIENDKIEFHIAGSGESNEQLKDIAVKLSSSDKIIFYGEYNYNKLPEIISHWDIGVIPYQINDFNNYTIHNKIFDFFAMGKPVFCSETKPFKRIISETNAGILVNCEKEFEIRNAILKMADMDLSDMSNNGRKSFEDKYNWDFDSLNLINFIKRFV